MILSIFKFYCFHLCSYKLCYPVLDYYQLIFHLFISSFNIQTDLHVYIYITQYVSIFKDCMVYWHIGERDRFNSCCCQGILFCIEYLYFMSRIPYYLHMELPQTIFVECCLEIFYIHILCFSLLTAWRTPNK